MDCASLYCGGRMDSLRQILKRFACRSLPWLVLCVSYSLAFIYSHEASAASQPAVPWYAGCSMQTGGTWKCAGTVSIYNPWTQDANSAGQKTVAARNAYGDTQSPKWDQCTFSHVSGLSAYGSCQNGYSGAIGPIQRKYECPEGVTGTVEGDQCITEEPQNHCEQLKGQEASAGLYDIGTSPSGEMPSTACHNGCLVSFSGTSPAYTSLNGGVRHYYASGSYTYTDFQCSSGSGLPTALSSPPPDTCGPGLTMGQVNGKNRCVNVSTGQPAPTTPPPPQTETKDEQPPVQNEDGSTTQTTTTTHTDGSTTTTVTTTHPNGSTSTVTTKTPAPAADDFETYCQQNPDSPMCKEEEESSWGGGCGSFTCEGDAVQCAIAKEIHNRNCKLFEEEYPESNLYNSVVAGTDTGTTDNPALPQNREIINLPTELDDSNGGISGGLSDVSVSIPGGALNLPFSNLNPYLELMGFIVLGFSYFRAYKIVGGVK